MKLGKIISGDANFSFQYFINGGYIGSTCSVCETKIALYIEIYKTGKLVEQITDDLDENILAELIENKIVNLRNDKTKRHLRLSKYILWNMDALYFIITCETCKTEFLSIFGMDEIQPGREQVQFKGIWQFINR